MSSEILDSQVSNFTNPKLIVAESNLTVTDATKVMLDSKVNSILVFEDDEVIGIVTNKDILNDIVAKGLDPSKKTIREIMHSPLIKIHKDAKVREAISLMEKHGIRRLIVTDDTRTIGTIARKKIIGDLHELTIHLEELEKPDTQK